MTAPPLTREQALEEFMEYFRKWHAPKIFRAAEYAIERQRKGLTREQAQILVDEIKGLIRQCSALMKSDHEDVISAGLPSTCGAYLALIAIAEAEDA